MSSSAQLHAGQMNYAWLVSSRALACFLINFSGMGASALHVIKWICSYSCNPHCV